MTPQKPFSLRSFKKQARKRKNSMRRFLSKIERNTPRGIERTVAVLEKEVWAVTDCLACANCCKTMTPTFNAKDLVRISAHFGQTVDEFKAKWLYREKGGARDWMDKKQPCQFLNLKDNKCSIYAVRPDDCAGFPHLPKKMKDYVHVHKQNIEYCPATFNLVERMMENITFAGK